MIRHFENWIRFRTDVQGDTTALLDPLEGANLKQWPTYPYNYSYVYTRDHTL
jgi:hypothetical protein